MVIRSVIACASLAASREFGLVTTTNEIVAYALLKPLLT